jgi:hypothetical protein
MIIPATTIYFTACRRMAIKNPLHVNGVIMSEREVLIKEINGLPDFMINQLLGIVRYIKIGIENEYVSISDNVFYNSDQFKNIVSKSITEYRSGKTEDMDIL